jgi:hypothetical protein
VARRGTLHPNSLAAFGEARHERAKQESNTTALSGDRLHDELAVVSDTTIVALNGVRRVPSQALASGKIRALLRMEALTCRSHRK